jgi:hypothetical protein
MSTVKVNTVDKRTGGTLTLGGCGTTVTLGAGATQSGFGRTGTVDWCTTAKTAPFTGVSGNGYFVNTTSGVVTVTLPATPSAGDIISIADYASTFQTNNLTLCNNGSKINGVCATAVLSTQGQSITLVYVDATRGWKNTMDSTSNVTATPNYIIATGGTITCCGDYKIHTFTSDGCFAVTNAGTPTGSTTVDYLVVAGGGGGGGFENRGGGGGAGGYRESFPNPATGGLPVSIQSYPITVGAGGGASLCAPTRGTNGNGSTFSTITSTGGGGGGGGSGLTSGSTGGSGGGASSFNNSGPAPGGTGNTPPTSPSQGNNGGDATGGPSPDGGNTSAGGGGGGAAAVGGTYSPPSNIGANGGIGSTTAINPSPSVGTPGPAPGRYFAGGGGGGNNPAGAPTAGVGGAGGGGAGKNYPGPAAVAGGTNTGGGGGGGAAAGGSGIVIIRYKFQ